MDVGARGRPFLDAPLGRWFKDGAELSGGQWQKVALSRAFMREQADVLVLDEPDVVARRRGRAYAVFERFRALAQGRTTIVISRTASPPYGWRGASSCSTTAASSGGGRPTSSWPWAARYAHMFALQAEGYR